MNEKLWVFDGQSQMRFVECRQEFLTKILSLLSAQLDLKTAIDVGCGIGLFSHYLVNAGFTVKAVDGREENVLEARKRFPHIDFDIWNVEERPSKNWGMFDIVLCFGLLYHLENPFLALRHFHSLTKSILLIESIVVPSQAPIARLVNEHQGKDQGLQYVAFIPTESCLIRMLYHVGFSYVYRSSTFPHHEEFRTTFFTKRRRTFLIASKQKLSSSQLQHFPIHSQRSTYLWHRRWFAIWRTFIDIFHHQQ